MSRPEDESTREHVFEERPSRMPLLDELSLPQPSDGRYIARVGSYDVIEVLGQGRMGVVLKAYDDMLQRHVALKLMLPEFSREELARKRFIREARAAARLEHPNVVTVHTVGAEGEVPYIVMEYVEGESLASLLVDERCFEPERALSLTRQILSALEHAHAEGIVHRDVKPANALLKRKSKTVKLVDFGLARVLADTAAHTGPGTISGSPAYMSPEQASGRGVIDGRSDLFSVGIVLFEMLAGVRPFRAGNPIKLLLDICREPHPDPRQFCPSIPADIVCVLDRALNKSPDERYSTASEFIAAIDEFLGPVPGLTERPSSIAMLLNAAHKQRSLRVRLWTQRGIVSSTRDIMCVSGGTTVSYQIGDEFTLLAQSEQDCYLTLFDIGTSGSVSLLLADHSISAGEPVRLSGPGQDQQWFVGGPPGVERLKAFFTLQPLACGSDATGSTKPLHQEPVQGVAATVDRLRLALEQLPDATWTDVMYQFVVEAKRT